MIFVIAAPKVGRFTFPRRGAGTRSKKRGEAVVPVDANVLVRLDRGEHSPGDATGVGGDRGVYSPSGVGYSTSVWKG